MWIEDYDVDWDKVLVYVDYVLLFLCDNRDFLWVVYGVDGLVECYFDKDDVYGVFVVCLDKWIKGGEFCGEV